MNVAREEDDASEVAACWCIRLAEGPLAPAEQREFNDWLSGNPGHQRLFERTVVAWAAIEDQAAQPELLQMRGEALAALRRAGARRWHRPSSPGRQVLAVAACLLLLIGGGTWWRLAPTTYHTGVGERQVVALADGSVVSLDAATEVKVRYLRDRRELWLDHGRAKFSVAKDPLRPFTVQSGERMVVATGTQFSVERLATDVRVILYEGHVAVLDTGPATPLPVTLPIGPRRATSEQALHPGSELILPDAPPAAASSSAEVRGAPPATGRVVPIDVGRTLGWEAGMLEFTDEPLGDAAERMNRYAPRPLRVTGAARGLAISGQFEGGDVGAFVEGITSVFPVEAVRDADGGTELRVTRARQAGKK